MRVYLPVIFKIVFTKNLGHQKYPKSTKTGEAQAANHKSTVLKSEILNPVLYTIALGGGDWEKRVEGESPMMMAICVSNPVRIAIQRDCEGCCCSMAHHNGNAIVM
jgi:hypothetical protein